jgi:ring-1,2-phenylacetyl-CoA epoxidase subunit PaaA
VTDEAQAEAFYAHVSTGGKVEADDWMPDDYRAAVLKFVEMHANSELMGVLPERDWILRAPTLRRKLALTSKIQDEVGHAQLLYRVAEDLGKPRERMLDDLLAGKTKFHNVFHYPTRSWGDVGIIAWLVDAAAIVSQQALRDSSYAPYARTMKKICWEESVHIMHGRDVVLTLMTGTDTQRAMVQEALDRWWGPLMQMHGPPTDPVTDRDLIWQIKSKGNEQLRQEFLGIYAPRIWELGLTMPDPALAYDEATGRWHYTEPDWDELRSVVTGHGPMSQERLAFRRLHRDETQWVRDAVLGVAA